MGVEETLTPEQVTGLLRFARVLTGDRQLAEDLVQDVLVQLVRAARPHVEHSDAYTRRMVLNGYLSWRRKWARIVPSERLPDAPETDAGDDRVDLRDSLDAALRALTRKQRAAIVLRFYLDLGDADAAAELGCSVATFRSHVSRGLSALRIELATEVPS